ncbi:Nucleoid-associated protein YejK [anaerobic digester metagenome]
MAKRLRPIGENIVIKGFVIHKITKEAGSIKTTVKKAKKTIPVTNKEKKFIGSLNISYSNKSGPIYGIFGTEDQNFQKELSAYEKNRDFLSFSIKATEVYKTEISKSAPATGAFLIFALFNNTDNKKDYLFVLTINNKEGYFVTDDLLLQDIQNLDLSKLDVASRINLTDWRSHNLGDKNIKTYLSFVRGNKEISNYFMNFIGCEDKNSGTESTKRLNLALDDYLESKYTTREERINKKNEVYDYCNKCHKEKKPINLSAVSALIDNENPELFKEFASNEDYGVSEVFSGDPQYLKRIKFTRYKDKLITIEFDNNLFNKSVIYDKQNRELIFKDLPQELINELNKNVVQDN